jgi:hypothetical protein
VFKNKTLITGIGIGLVIGALLLQLMNSFISQAPVNTDGTGKIYTQEQLDAAVTEAKAAISPPSSTPVSTSPTPSPAPVVIKKISVFVDKGMASDEVADLIVKSGVFLDKKELIKQFEANQVDTKLKSGLHVFEITDKMNVQEIITNLITVH